jgi:hypothetical protein
LHAPAGRDLLAAAAAQVADGAVDAHAAAARVLRMLTADG